MARELTTAARAAMLALSLTAIGAYSYVSLSRAAFPFSLEWIEPNAFLHVVRVLQGQSLYVPPSFDFIPMVYTPLYYYLAAPFAALTGQIMLSLRLISIVASGLSFAAIYGICRVRGTSRATAFLAVGLFAASYAKTGFWLDLAKVDSLYLSLLLLAYLLSIVNTKQDALAGVLAGLTIFLSMAAKQQAIGLVPFLLVGLVLERRWERAMTLGLTFMVTSVVSVASLNAWSGGWFWFYTVTVPSAHPVSWAMILRDFWTTFVLPDYGLLLLVVLAAAATLAARWNRSELARYLRFLLTFLAPMLAISLISMSKQWSYLNGLLPFAAAIAVAAAEGYHIIATPVAPRGADSRWQKGVWLAVSLAIVLQFVSLRYDPRGQLPTAANLEAGNWTLSVLRASEAPAFAPSSPDLLYMAEMPANFHASAFGDLNLAAQRDPGVRALVAAYLNAISARITNRSIRTAFLPNATWYDAVFTAERGYTCRDLVDPGQRLTTLAGAISYLDHLCILQPGEPQ